MAGTDIANAPQGGQDIQVARTSNRIPVQDRLSMMREALTNPAVNPDKAREMFMLMKEVELDAQREEFNSSKIAAMRAMPAIFKRGMNSHLQTRYAKFEDMHRAIMPVLAEHNLTLDFVIGNEGRDVTVQPVVRHDNGYIEKGGTMRSPPVEGKGLNIAQSQAIALAYLKRHSFKATFNLIEDDEDTDGSTPRGGDLLNDRQERLLVDAQEQFEAGSYTEWYGRLPVKDRALMVSLGHHARFGGKLLPGSKPDPVQKPAEDPVPTSLLSERGNDLTTAEGWTAEYEANCADAKTHDDLARIISKAAGARGRLEGAHPDLFKRAVEAGNTATRRLMDE